jgi:hypothetical protein
MILTQILGKKLLHQTLLRSLQLPQNMHAYSGHRGPVISATSTSLTIGGLGKNSNLCQGLKVRIIAGKGAGQERTINAVSDGVIHDFGLATTATALAIGDSTKKWRVNQWDGYNVRLTFNTGQLQVRTVLYNDTTTLTVSDTNFQAIDSFNNTGFSCCYSVCYSRNYSRFTNAFCD